MLNFLLLQANNEGGSMYQAIMIGSMLVVFYFFMIRPQQKRRKEQRTLLEELKKGTQVVTIGGIYGKVHDVSEDTVTLEVDNKGAKITVAKGAISLDSTKRHTQKK